MLSWSSDGEFLKGPGNGPQSLGLAEGMSSYFEINLERDEGTYSTFPGRLLLEVGERLGSCDIS